MRGVGPSFGGAIRAMFVALARSQSRLPPGDGLGAGTPRALQRYVATREVPRAKQAVSPPRSLAMGEVLRAKQAVQPPQSRTNL